MTEPKQYDYVSKMALLLVLIAKNEGETKEILIDILEDVRDLAESSQELEDFLDSYVPEFHELS